LARWSITVWSCGRCGKPRGLHHLCTGGKKGRDRIGLRVALKFTCPSCGAQTASLLTHTCVKRTDFRKLRAAQQRRERAEDRKRKRRAAAARKRARLRERKRQAAERRRQQRQETAKARKAAARNRTHDKQRHEHRECADPYCAKYQCRIYREGQEDGQAAGYAEGYAEGYAAGTAASL
jgi:hypothetical protein